MTKHLGLIKNKETGITLQYFDEDENGYRASKRSDKEEHWLSKSGSVN